MDADDYEPATTQDFMFKPSNVEYNEKVYQNAQFVPSKTRDAKHVYSDTLKFEKIPDKPECSDPHNTDFKRV